MLLALQQLMGTEFSWKSQNQLCGHLRTDGTLEARHKERIWNQSLMLKRRLTSTGEVQKVEGRFAGKVVCSTELCSKILEFPTRSHTVMPVQCVGLLLGCCMQMLACQYYCKNGSPGISSIVRTTGQDGEQSLSSMSTLFRA